MDISCHSIHTSMSAPSPFVFVSLDPGGRNFLSYSSFRFKAGWDGSYILVCASGATNVSRSIYGLWAVWKGFTGPPIRGTTSRPSHVVPPPAPQPWYQRLHKRKSRLYMVLTVLIIYYIQLRLGREGYDRHSVPPLRPLRNKIMT